MKSVVVISLVMAVGAAVAPFAASAADDHAAIHAAHSGTSEGGTALTDGEIRKVDKDAGKLTIKHGELKNLEMPPMTMIFRVKDKAMLDQVKAGDKIRFVADKVDGKITVMQLDVAQ